jgi:hypothetical protein
MLLMMLNLINLLINMYAAIELKKEKESDANEEKQKSNRISSSSRSVLVVVEVISLFYD